MRAAAPMPLEAPPLPPGPQRMLTRPSPVNVLIVLAACFLAAWWRLGSSGLFDLDEGLYAEAAREMRLSGDWVTPRVNGEPFFEKPPLIYWAGAAVFALAGRSELTARAPSALATTLLALLVLAFGTRYFGRRAGLAAALFLVLSPLILGEARQLITDATLNLCVAGALMAFFAVQRRPDGRASLLAAHAFWALCALGVLTKGLPGIALPGLVGLIYLVARRKHDTRSVWGGIRAMRPLTGLLLFLLIAVPWHAAAWLQAGEAFHGEYIMRQHLSRFRGGDTAHLAPFWFYVPVFLVACLPWSVLLPAALWDRRRRTPGPTPPPDADPEAARTLCTVWALTVFVLFSASGSKLVSYILPMLPPAALLTADWCVRAAAAGRRRPFAVGLGAALALLGVVLAVVLAREQVAAAVAARTGKPVDLGGVPEGVFAATAAVLGAGAAGITAALALVLARRHTAAFAAAVAGMAGVAAAAAGLLLPELDAALLAPVRASALVADRAAGRNAPLGLAVGPPRRPSVLFYLPDHRLRGAGSAQRVFETADVQRAREFAEAHPHGVLLSDPRHAAVPLEGWRPMASFGGWTVRAGPEWRRR